MKKACRVGRSAGTSDLLFVVPPSGGRVDSAWRRDYKQEVAWVHTSALAASASAHPTTTSGRLSGAKPALAASLVTFSAFLSLTTAMGWAFCSGWSTTLARISARRLLS